MASLHTSPWEDTVPLTTSLVPGARSASSLLLLLLPHGGQQRARRNAWAGMSADAARGRARREAAAALVGAEDRAHARPARQGSTGG